MSVLLSSTLFKLGTMVHQIISYATALGLSVIPCSVDSAEFPYITLKCIKCKLKN